MSTCIARGLEHSTRQDRGVLRWASRVLAAVIVVVICAQSAPAQSIAARCGERTYSFQTIDPPYGTPGVDMTVQALWINNWGTVVAQYQAPPDPDWFANMHGAVLQRGTWTNVDVEDALSSAGVPNNRGQLLVMYRLLQDGPWHLAIRDRHGLKLLPDLADYPGGIIGNGFNDLGQMAAVAIDAAGAWHGLVGSVERHVIVDYPDAVATIPMGLNNRGMAVGYYGLPDGSNRGFWYRRGQVGAIDVPGAVNTWPCAINNWSVVVGNYQTPARVLGFLLERGRFTDFRVPNASWTNIYFINDLGQISGTYGDANGVAHGFVATPAHGK
jgi:hypothetical protein